MPRQNALVSLFEEAEFERVAVKRKKQRTPLILSDMF